MTPQEQKIISGAKETIRDARSVILARKEAGLISKKVIEDLLPIIEDTNSTVESHSEAIRAIKQQVLEVATIKGDKGDRGDSPTDEELILLIKPLMPEPIIGKDGKDGKSPTKKELLSLIKPLIPKEVLPSDEKLWSLIKPLIPISAPGKDGKDGKDGSPDEPFEIRDKLETLKDDNRLDASAIKNLEIGDKQVVITHSAGLDIGTVNANYLKLDCANDPLTALLDLPGIYNSLGNLKIMPDAQGDVGLFGDTDVANGSDGRVFSINRRAAEGDTYLNLYINDDQAAYIDSNWDISIRSNLAGGVIELGAIATNVVSLIGDTNRIGEPSGTENLPLRHYGYITAGANQRYVTWLLDDTDDFYHLTRSSANILGLKVEIPTTIEPDVDTLTGFVVNDTDSNNVLTVDTTNNRVGIGGTATGSLHIVGSTANDTGFKTSGAFGSGSITSVAGTSSNSRVYLLSPTCSWTNADASNFAALSFSPFIKPIDAISGTIWNYLINCKPTTSSANITELVNTSYLCQLQADYTGTIATYTAVSINAPSLGGGAVTNIVGLNVANLGATQTAITTGTGKVNFGDDTTVSSATGGSLTLKRVDASITANDTIGTLQFYAADTQTTTNNIVANIEAQATNTIGTDINPGRLIFRTTSTTVAATPTERMRIDEAGNVGIGTTNPTAKLHIVGSADTQQLIVKGNATQTSNIQEWQNSAGTTLAGVTGGKLFLGGIAALSSENQLSVLYANSTTASATLSGTRYQTNVTPGASSASTTQSFYSLMAINGGANDITVVSRGINNTIATSAGHSGTIANIQVGYNLFQHAGAGSTVTLCAGTHSGITISSGGGPITTGRSYTALATNASASLFGTYVGYLVQTPTNTGGGGYTNIYGLSIQAFGGLGGTINCAISTADGLVILNEAGHADADVRIEGDTNINLLFTDASTDRVGIGTATPYSLLDVSSATGGVLTLTRADTTVTAADTIGTLQFYAADTQTTSNFIVANIEAQATNTIATDINPGRLIFRTTPTTVAGTPTEVFRLTETQDIQIAEANDIILGTTTGTKFGTAATQKLSFYNATPIVQPSAYTQTYSTASKTMPNATAADLATTATTQITPYGFATQAQGDNIATQFNLLRADLDATKKVVNQILDDLQSLGLLS